MILLSGWQTRAGEQENVGANETSPRSRTNTRRRTLARANRRMGARYLASLAIAGALACDLVTNPVPAGAVHFVTPPEYRLWWRMTETCSGRQGNLGDVSLYVVPGVDRVTTASGQVVQSYWQTESHRIILASSVQFNGPVVRHEMLHALLGNVPGHPRNEFLYRCGGIVDCPVTCLDSATAAPPDPSSFVVLPSDSLELIATLSPTAPSSSAYNGEFAVIVSVTNKRAVPVLVNSGIGHLYGFRILGPSLLIQRSLGGGDPQPATFLAGQTKVLAFDLAVRDRVWPAGPLELWPSFAGYEAKVPLRFTVNP
jgi:hypothetical protein